MAHLRLEISHRVGSHHSSLKTAPNAQPRHHRHACARSNHPKHRWGWKQAPPGTPRGLPSAKPALILEHTTQQVELNSSEKSRTSTARLPSSSAVSCEPHFLLQQLVFDEAILDDYNVPFIHGHRLPAKHVCFSIRISLPTQKCKMISAHRFLLTASLVLKV